VEAPIKESFKLLYSWNSGRQCFEVAYQQLYPVGGR
jgi:hypothetical protein